MVFALNFCKVEGGGGEGGGSGGGTWLKIIVANLAYVVSGHQNVPGCQVSVDKTLFEGEIVHT